GLSTYVGTRLVKGCKRAFFFSIFVQALQVLHLNTHKLAFQFLAGPLLELNVSPNLFGIAIGCGATADLGARVTNTPSSVGTLFVYHFGIVLDPSLPTQSPRFGLNVVALLFAIWLWRCRKLVLGASPNQVL